MTQANSLRIKRDPSTPINDRSRFVRRVAPTSLSVANIDRQPDPQQTEQQYDDHDVAAVSVGVSLLRARMLRPTLPKKPPLTRLVEISNHCSADEKSLTVTKLKRRGDKYKFFQFGKYRVIDISDSPRERTDEKAEMLQQLQSVQLGERSLLAPNQTSEDAGSGFDLGDHEGFDAVFNAKQVLVLAQGHMDAMALRFFETSRGHSSSE